MKYVPKNIIRIAVALLLIAIVIAVEAMLWSSEQDAVFPDDSVSPAQPGVDQVQPEEREADVVSEPTAMTDYRDLVTREASVTEVVTALDAPWGFDWLPTGELLVTERFGSLKLVQNGQSTSVAGAPTVFSGGQGGLLDVSVHPDFSTNQMIYLSYAVGTQEENRLEVMRAELIEAALINPEVIFTVAETKSGSQHFGSRFAWLPDGTLLFSVGDGGNPPIEYNNELIREQAQNLSAHLGKIIRIHDDGSIPADNPFVGRPDVNPEIYSYGHRNAQGLTYDVIHNRVIASEHGSKGGDELNSIVAGANYGWPLTSYATEYDAFSTEISPTQTLPGTNNPLAVWTPTIAPSSVVHYTGDAYDMESGGDVFLTAMLLRSNTNISAYAFRPAGAIIRLLTNEAGTITGQERITLGDVRVRSIAQGPDGFLYALTDTTDRQSRPGTQAGTVVRITNF